MSHDAISRALGAATGALTTAKTVDEKKELVETAGKDMVQVREENRNADYEFARKNLKDVIQQGAGLVQTIIAVAREAEQANMFDAAAKFLKTLSDLNKDLVELSDEPRGRHTGKPAKTAADPAPGAPAQVSQTNIYVGADDLLDAALAKQKKGGTAIDADFSEVDDPESAE